MNVIVGCCPQYQLVWQHYFQVINECNKAEQWLREMRQQQDLYPKNSDPVLISIDIKNKTEELNSYGFFTFPFSFSDVHDCRVIW